MRKFLKFTAISLILLVSLTGCSNNKEKEEKILKEKLNSEISFLDNELQEMINKLNGISFENYKVTSDTVEQIESKSSSSGGKSDSSDTSSGKNDDKKSEASETESTSTGNEKTTLYNMTSNSILEGNRQTNWSELKGEIENFYKSWTTMSVDLYKTKVNAEDILSFSSDLDSATQSIKNEDKESSLINIAKLYSYIPKFAEIFMDNKNNLDIYKTKSEILNAYAIVEKGSNEEILRYLRLAEEKFNPILNNIDNTNKQMSINKTYVLIKEIEKTVDRRDVDLFYIKYSNLIQEIDKIITT